MCPARTGEYALHFITDCDRHDIREVSAVNETQNRQIGTVAGVFAVLVSLGVTALVGSAMVQHPVLLAQVGLLGAGGIAHLLGGLDSVRTGPLTWYQWQGVGNICIGLSLPLGFVGQSSTYLLVLFVTALGGVSLAAMGVDLLAFHGRYTREERLNARPE